MTIHVNVGQAKTRLCELLAAALRGEEVVLQKAGVPKAKIVPVEGAEQAEREAVAAKRAAAIGALAEKYAHLRGTDLLAIPPSMTEEEIEERFQRKFGAPSS